MGFARSENIDDENPRLLAPPCGSEYEVVDWEHKATCKKYQGK